MAVVAMALSSFLWALEVVAAVASEAALEAALEAEVLAAVAVALAGKMLILNILTKNIIKQ
jgi:hypothetical protein